MQTFILAFILMLLVFVGMSLGYFFRKKPIAGSCGGLGAVGIEKACDCDRPCATAQKAQAEETEAKKPYIKEL